MKRSGGSWLAGIVLALASCGPDTVELVRFASDAQVAPRDDATTALERDAGAPFEAGSALPGSEDAGARPRTCDSKSDCFDDEYCEKPACGLTTGACQKRPLVCNSELSPECGCDGFMYFNTCLRQRAATGRAQDRSCLTRRCSDGGPGCPGASYCVRSTSDGFACRGTFREACWILPGACGPAMGGGDRYSPCEGPELCLDLCSAITTERPFGFVQRCMQPRNPAQP